MIYHDHPKQESSSGGWFGIWFFHPNGMMLPIDEDIFCGVGSTTRKKDIITLRCHQR
jgi:hypothetical protein